MAFLETTISDLLALGFLGGPRFKTTVIATDSGLEARNADWELEKRRFDLGYAGRLQSEKDAIDAMFLIAKGRANGWRLRDPSDYTTSVANGKLAAGQGLGVPDYELFKTYGHDSYTHLRRINKPRSGGTVYRNSSPVTVGSGAGQIAFDTATGKVVFVADAYGFVTGLTLGATTTVVLNVSDPGLIAGQLMYLDRLEGADASLLNGLAHTINSVSGTGPWTYVLATNTTGKSIVIGTGRGYKYPQPTDILTWSGEFDVPVRFDTDEIVWTIANKSGGQYVYNAETIPVVEIIP